MLFTLISLKVAVLTLSINSKRAAVALTRTIWEFRWEFLCFVQRMLKSRNPAWAIWYSGGHQHSLSSGVLFKQAEAWQETGVLPSRKGRIACEGQEVYNTPRCKWDPCHPPWPQLHQTNICHAKRPESSIISLPLHSVWSQSSCCDLIR